MDWKKISDKKAKLSEAAKRIEGQKKQITYVERKYKTKRYIQLGELFEKAGFDILDQKNDAFLFGGLLELKEKSSTPQTIEKLIGLANEHKQAHPQKYIISCPIPPTEQAIKLLEALKFKWHESLHEWHGRAKKDDLAPLIKDSRFVIEAVQ